MPPKIKLYLQVIGTLPLLVNPASLAAGAATPTLPLQGLQVQTVTPQLLLNTQGQIIATVGNGVAPVATSAAVLPKAAAPPTLSKPITQVDLPGKVYSNNYHTLKCICSLPGFCNNSQPVASCHRPAAICVEKRHQRPHHLWRHSKSGPARQQYVELLLLSKHRSGLLGGYF